MTTTVPLPLRLALRRLSRRRGYALAALIIFTVGTASSAFLFGLYRGLFLRPLPYPDETTLYTIGHRTRNSVGRDGEMAAAGVDFMKYFQGATAFSAIGAHTPRELSVVVGTTPEGITGEAVSASLFEVLGARTVLGRVFSRQEDHDSAAVMVVSHRFWQRRLGGDPGIVGQALRVDGMPRVVVGVLAPEFRTLLVSADVYVPLASTPTQPGPPGRAILSLVGRLAPGQTALTAEGQVKTLAEDVSREFPATHGNRAAFLRPIREHYYATRRPVLLIMGVGLTFLMVIGCANLAQLALVDASARRGEHLLQLALGARAERLVAELGIQNGLLALAGGIAGLLVARAGGPLILRLDPTLAQQAGPVAFDAMMGLVAIGASFLAALLASLLPLVSLARTRTALRHDARTPAARQRLVRLGLLGSEVALAVVLLLGGGMVLHGLLKLQGQDPGWQADGLLAGQIVLPQARYAAAADRTGFVDRLLEAVRTGPGVVDAAITMTRFRQGTDMLTQMAAEGQEDNPPLVPHFRRITPGMIRMVGGRMVSGREFLSTDVAGAPRVAVLSRTLAEQLWPGQDAVGKRFKRPVQAPEWTTVVGVVDDMNDLGPGFDNLPTMYLPYAQNSTAGIAWAPVTLLIKTRGAPGGLTEFVRRTVASVDPDLSIEGPYPAAELTAGAFDPQRLQVVLLGGFGLVSLVLVAAGLIGVTIQSVAERRRELGIRLALGATAGGVLAVVVRQVLLAVAAGALLASVLSPGVRGAVGRLTPATPPPLGGLLLWISVTVLAFALVTGLLAAHRVNRIDPVESLKE